VGRVLVRRRGGAGLCGHRVPPPPPGPGRTDNHAFLLRLAAELAAQDPPVTLVLDDLHQITGHELDDGLQYLIRNMQPGLQVVICSRADPVMPLHQYRLAGKLTEIRAAELAFSVSEAQLLMDQHGVTLPRWLLEQLTEHSEGWAAGLRMAALSLREEPDPEQFAQRFAAGNSAISGYLMEQVFNDQPACHRDLLLKTSILDRVNAGIAVELTGDEGAGDALGALAHANAFVEPVGHGWYRFHALFAEVLRLELRFSRQREVVDLHRRAARWFHSHGFLLEAVRQAAAAGDWLLAARLLVDDLAIGALFEEPGGGQLAECFRAMPRASSGAKPPPALVAAALALLDGQEEDAWSALDAVEDALACFVAARCRLAEGHASAASELAVRARLGWSPPGWLDDRLTLLESRASATVGDIDSAVAAAERGGPTVSLDSAVALAQARLDARDPQAAARALGNGPAITGETPAASRVDWWLAEARLAFDNDDDRHGRQSLMKAVRLGEREELRLSFALESAWMRPVLRGDPQLAEACRHVLVPEQATGGHPATLDTADPVFVEELSVREREVLRLLSGMLTTAEVASELYISVNTVKTHLKSIFRKLEASHRGEAVRRAKQLRMI
jgi:ATP/maltotriose-dependent transcriptional regulator MalT